MPIHHEDVDIFVLRILAAGDADGIVSGPYPLGNMNFCSKCVGIVVSICTRFLSDTFRSPAFLTDISVWTKIVDKLEEWYHHTWRHNYEENQSVYWYWKTSASEIWCWSDRSTTCIFYKLGRFTVFVTQMKLLSISIKYWLSATLIFKWFTFEFLTSDLLPFTY